MKNLCMKTIFILIVTAILGIGAASLFYIKIIPSAVSNQKVIITAEKIATKYLGLDVNIENPKMMTNLSGDVYFFLDNISVNKNNENILQISKLDTQISVSKILNKVIIVKHLGADNIFADVNKLLECFPSDNKDNKKKKSDWTFDLFDSTLCLKKSFIIYNINPETKIELKANNLNIIQYSKRIGKVIHFDINADIIKNNKTVNVATKDDYKVEIENNHIYVKNCPLIINKSKLYFNAEADKNDYEINIYAKRFFIPDIIKLLETNIVENNVKESLAVLKDLNGDFDLNLVLNKQGISGNIDFNRISAKLIPLNNLSVILKGNDITLKNFKGFYDNKKYNTFDFEGSIKDYLKTLDTHIQMHVILTNDFMEKYLSKTAMVPLTLVGEAPSKIIIDSKNSDMDITLMGKIGQGNDILVAGSSLSPKTYDRALKADLHLRGSNLNIESIKYYIAKELTRESKGIKPILTLDGNINIVTGKIKDIGFDIPKPLPSEFLNVLISQRIFKGGKFSGTMHMTDNGEYPVLSGNMYAENIRIPSQRMMIKQGEITTNNNMINIDAAGRFRRSLYTFDGHILNAIKFPIVIKETNLTLDEVNVERLMKAFQAPVQPASYDSSEEDDENAQPAQTFDLANLIIEKAQLNINKGSYKEINFKDVTANMSLDKNSIFNLYSNRFEIAEGHSSAKVNCDLKNQKYNIKLGIKDVNSDLMSTAILNLKREISGKASGLIDISTDESLKLNGKIKFIVKDGTIQKIGLVEYVLKFASLFRNPIAMLSPGMFADIVNIPEGNFDKIEGDLIIKNNVIELLKIKSYSPQLSAFIIGRYDLENSDAILRIYTKFSNKRKGFGGILRNISLNALANRLPLNSRNDANYYSAELEQLPDIEADEKDCQVFLTKVDGDVEHNNFISSLKKIK